MLLLVLLHCLCFCCCWLLATLTWLRPCPEAWWEGISLIRIQSLPPQNRTPGIQNHTEWDIIIIIIIMMMPLLLTLRPQREVTVDSCFFWFSYWVCFWFHSIKAALEIQLLCSSFRLVTLVAVIPLLLLSITNEFCAEFVCIFAVSHLWYPE